MKLSLSRIHFPVTTLGPGRRIGIWFQGCSIHCDGCISVDTWATRPGTTTVETVIEAIGTWLPEADGITVSGGEPFDQIDALRELLAAIRSRVETNILVYSGYPVERLGDALTECGGLIDGLISDPYDKHASQTLALRGSDNQRFHLLSDIGRQHFSAFVCAPIPEPPALDIMFNEDGTAWMAGIPGKDDFERLSAVLRACGHTVRTSQASKRSV